MGLACSSFGRLSPLFPLFPLIPLLIPSLDFSLPPFLKVQNMKLKHEILPNLILFIGTSRIYLRLLSPPLIDVASGPTPE